MVRVSWSFLAVLCLHVHTVYGQNDSSLKGFGVEANILTGRIIRHCAKFTAPIPDVSVAQDVNLIWQTYGKKDWQQRRNYPQVGLGVTYTDYGSNQVFGKCIALYPNLLIPLLRMDKLEWTLRIGDGIGYVTKMYSPKDTVNTAIGSNINDFGIFMTDVRYHVNEHWHLQCGFNLTHISNAAYSTPNLGVNMVGTHIGIQYFPVSNRPKPEYRAVPKLSNRWLAQFKMGVGYNEANATGNPELPTYILSGYASKRWLGKNKFFAGMDYAYHESTYAFYKTYEIYPKHEHANACDGTIFVGNEFLFGRVGIVTQVGYYYRKTYLKYGNDPLNEKVGGHLYLIQKEHGVLKELFLSAILTTHMAVAEYAEFGIGTGF